MRNLDPVANSMISLWILDRESGICIFNQEFSKLVTHLDPGIIGGFFSATITFYLKLLGKEVMHIHMEGLRLHFHYTNHSIIAVALKDDVKSYQVNIFLGKIAVFFDDRYAKYLNKDVIEKKVFRHFANDLEAFIGRKSQKISYISESKEFLKNRQELTNIEFNRLQYVLKEQSTKFKLKKDKLLSCEKKEGLDEYCIDEKENSN